MNMVTFAAMLHNETRMTHVCITRGLGTHLLGCLFSNTDVCILTAVAYIDIKSHVEVVKSGPSLHRTTLGMHGAQIQHLLQQKARIVGSMHENLYSGDGWQSSVHRVLVGRECVMGSPTLLLSLPVCMYACLGC